MRKYLFEDDYDLRLKERRLVFLYFRTKKWRVLKKVAKKLDELYGVK